MRISEALKLDLRESNLANSSRWRTDARETGYDPINYAIEDLHFARSIATRAVEYAARLELELEELRAEKIVGVIAGDGGDDDLALTPIAAHAACHEEAL